MCQGNQNRSLQLNSLIVLYQIVSAISHAEILEIFRLRRAFAGSSNLTILTINRSFEYLPQILALISKPLLGHSVYENSQKFSPAAGIYWVIKLTTCPETAV